MVLLSTLGRQGQHCSAQDKPLCEQGISLVNYVFPSPMVLGPDVVPWLPWVCFTGRRH